MKTGNAAVFLDRDGTITREAGYLTRLDLLELFPGAGQAVRRINQEGFLAVLITNQSGVARGLFPRSLVEEAHRKLRGLLSREGARLDGVYVCPHLPEGSVPELAIACDCRKPAPGLFQLACEEMDIDPDRSYAIGDSYRDLAPAASLGARTILVQTGHGQKELAESDAWPRRPDHIADDLSAAVDWLLANRMTS